VSAPERLIAVVSFPGQQRSAESRRELLELQVVLAIVGVVDKDAANVMKHPAR
jgi:hypothetical protein